MLWDLIRDFFVQHVFGGYLSNGDFINTMLSDYSNEEITWFIPTGDDIVDVTTHNGFAITLGDWLSTTATAISITIIVVLCCMFIYKIIKLIGGLIR